MKKSLKIILVILITGITLTAGAAYSHRYYHGKGCNYAERLTDRITQELELDSTQSAQLEALKQRMLNIKVDMRAQRDGVKQKIMMLFNDTTMDRDAAHKLAAERVDSIDNLASQLITDIGNFYDSLSPEQQQRLRDKVGERMEHRHRHW